MCLIVKRRCASAIPTVQEDKQYRGKEAEGESGQQHQPIVGGRDTRVRYDIGVEAYGSIGVCEDENKYKKTTSCNTDLCVAQGRLLRDFLRATQDINFYPLSKILLQKKLQNCLRNGAEWLLP